MYRYLFVFVLLVTGLMTSYSQVDTIPPAPVDTTQQMVPDSAVAAATSDTVPPATSEAKQHKKYDKFKVCAGLSVGDMNTDTRSYSATAGYGYLLGFSYQRGRFFYWEVGADFNATRFELTDVKTPGNESTGTFDLKSIDLPVSVGINILSPLDRIVGLRAFVGATPSFMIDVGDNDLGISKDNVNSFNPYAHIGLGVNITFLYVEAIYKVGFNDLLADDQSKPRQFQARLGFRF